MNPTIVLAAATPISRAGTKTANTSRRTVAAFAARLWWRLLHEDADSSPPPAGTADAARDEPPDAQLEAWREYLARLHAQSPPGGPPGDY